MPSQLCGRPKSSFSQRMTTTCVCAAAGLMIQRPVFWSMVLASQSPARAPGVTPPLRKRRPGKGYDEAEGEDGSPAELLPGATAEEWTPEAIGERVPSDKRVRKVRRSVTG